MNQDAQRRVLLVPHFYRKDNIESASLAARLLRKAGIDVRLPASLENSLVDHDDMLRSIEHVVDDENAATGCELVLVLGGDGTFLRAANYAHQQDVPVLGINLGHVGFLAEGEAESLDQVIAAIVQREYRVENRMTLGVTVFDADDAPLATGWALNECSIENADRSQVLDAFLDIDYRPVSSFGCDGVLVSTPTGSTAYAFSAGGPVMWPELDALLVVPNNAHALFAKPLVVSPSSVVGIRTSSSTGQACVVLDGFRRLVLSPGNRVEVTRGERPVRWVRLDDRPFADRLVDKFQLPVAGWRGPKK